jgi:hypothetical protein
MELKDNKVWILQGNGCFEIFSSKEYAKEYKKSLIEIWLKSIMRDSIPPSLNNRSEIEASADNYPNVIRVEDEHYGLIKGWSSDKYGTKESWRYTQLSNEDWKTYCQEYIDEFTITDYIIIK